MSNERDDAARASGLPSGCPSEEVLAAYADGGLGPSERERVAEHVSRCEDCYSIVREALAFGAEGEAGPRAAKLPRLSSVAVWLAMAATVAAAAVGGWLLLGQARSADPYVAVVRPMVDAVGDRRLFEARLTGGFRCGPLPDVTRAGGHPTVPEAKVFAAALQVAEESAGADARSTRAKAAAQVLMGRAAEAEDLLSTLTSRAPRDPDAWSDLAAVRLTLYRATGKELTLTQALDDADRALSLEARHPEASFNRALALQWRGLRLQAAQAWQEAAAAQVDGTWRKVALDALKDMGPVSFLDRSEIERRLGQALRARDRVALSAEIAASPWVAWDFFEEAVLPGLPEPAAREAARAFGEALLARTHDETALAVLAPEPRGQTLEATIDYSRARRLYRADHWTEAAALFERIGPELATAGSPLAGWTELHRLILLYQRGSGSTSDRLDRLRMGLDEHRTPLLVGRVEWMRALVAIGAGRLDDAVAAAEAGRRSYEYAGDGAAAAYLSGLRADAYRAAGRPDLAWSGTATSVRAVGRMPDRARAANALFQAGDLARASSLPGAAREMYREAAEMARRADSPIDLAEALIRLAQEPGTESAPELLRRARAAAGRVSDDAVSRRLNGEIRWLDLSARAGLGSVSAAEWHEAARWFLQRGDRPRAISALVREAEQHGRGGQIDAAARAYDRAFAEIEATRRLADDIGLALAEEARRVAEGWLRATPAKGPAWGLARVERYLALAYRGSGARPSQARPSGGAGAFSVSEAERVVVVAPLDSGASAWIVGPRSVAFRPLGPIGDGRTLAPLVPLIKGSRRVRLVALWEAADFSYGSWLAAQPELADVRAVSLLRRLPRSPGRARTGGSALAVGVSAAFGELPTLPFAEAEAAAFVSGVSGHLLCGAEATKANVARLLPKASAFYFAGHAVLNPERFGLSALVLAPDRGPSSLTANEIAKLDLRGLRVAILSACSTSVSRASSRYTRSSLADAFLAAGASAVVGTLADVSDREMSGVMGRLQASVASGISPAEAVLSLQRSTPTATPAGRVAASLVVWEGQT